MSAHVTSLLLDTIDAGAFERLASHVLRKKYPALIGHGINAEGKPVADPLDAGAVNVWVYHTTRSDLRSKWLATGERPGDLTVALERLGNLRVDVPDATATIILATNRRVASDLVDDVRKQAHSANVAIEVLEQSIIADYLDSTPDGQHARRRFFGISQDLLNADLLKAIARLSQRQYAAFSYRADAGALVHRKLDDALDNAIFGGQRVRFVVGQSGHGKTRALDAALTRHRLAGGIGLWMSPEIARDAPSIEAAIASTLRLFVPDLLSSCGRAALELARESGRPLMIVVDDLSTLPDPVPTAAKLATWNSNSQRVVAFVPVWSSTWDALPSEARERARYNVTVGRYLEKEAVDAVRLRVTGLDYARAHELAVQCAFDPLLIALLPQTIDAVAESRAGGMIHAYVKRVSVDLARRHSAMANDYHEVLLILGDVVLTQGVLSPPLEVIRTIFPDGSPQGARLRELLLDGRLIHIDDYLRFRHDRLRDILVADVLSTHLETGHPRLGDPFFCEPLGIALSRSTPSESLLQDLAVSNPLALAFAVTHFGSPKTPSQHLLVKLLQEVCSGRSNDIAMVYFPELDRVLARLDDLVVLELTGALPGAFVQSRFVNGAADAVIAFAYSLIERQYIDTEDWVNRALQKNASGVVDEVCRALNSPRDEDRRAALYLVPFLADRIDEAAIVGCIQGAQAPGRLAPDAAIALLRHPDPSRIGVLLEEILRLPAETTDGSYLYTRGAAADHIARYSVVFTGAAFEAVKSWAKSDLPSRQWLASGIYSRTDHPVAVDYCIRALAARYSEANALSNAVSLDYYVSPWIERGLPDRTETPLSKESIERIVRLWSGSSEVPAVRKVAWQYWLRTRRGDDRAMLIESIGPEDCLYEEALWFRIRHGDLRLRGVFLEKLRQDAENWFRLAKNNWDESVRVEVFRFTREVLDSGRSAEEALYTITSLMRDVPARDLDHFLADFGDRLYEPHLFVVALFAGTEQSLAYVSRWKDTFESAESVLGVGSFFHLGGSQDDDRITQAMIQRLETFLPRMKQLDLLTVREKGIALGMSEWIHDNVDIYLEGKFRAQVLPTLEDHYHRLDEAAAGHTSQAWHWFESFDDRGKSGREAMTIAREWFRSRKSVANFRVMASLVQLYGSRHDVEFLREDSVDINADEATAALARLRAIVSRRSLN